MPFYTAIDNDSKDVLEIFDKFGFDINNCDIGIIILKIFYERRTFYMEKKVTMQTKLHHFIIQLKIKQKRV